MCLWTGWGWVDGGTGERERERGEGEETETWEGGEVEFRDEGEEGSWFLQMSELG